MSRRGKKNWRKNVDIKEIEKNLEEVREEDRIIGGKIQDKQASELFYTDKSGNAELKQALKFKKLRLDEILEAKSAVPGISSRINLKSTAIPSGIPGKKHNISKNIKKHIDALAEQKRLAGQGPGYAVAQKKQKLQERKKALKHAKGGFDLWEEAPVKVVDEYMEPLLVKPVKKPQIVDTRPKSVPAVAISHSGASYRPSAEDHQAAIELAAEVEYKKMDSQEKVTKALAFPPEYSKKDEIVFEDSESESDALKSDDNEEVKVAKMKKRKTRSQRNRSQRHEDLQRMELKLKAEKKLGRQINAVKNIEKMLDNELKTKQMELEIRKAKESLLNDSRPKKMSRHGFKAAPVEIQLQDELADSLLRLKPEGNLFKDRFLSLQERSLIETRLPYKQKRKYRLKETESHDYKRFK